jgi:hypothetical protein
MNRIIFVIPRDLHLQQKHMKASELGQVKAQTGQALELRVRLCIPHMQSEAKRTECIYLVIGCDRWHARVYGIIIGKRVIGNQRKCEKSF